MYQIFPRNVLITSLAIGFGLALLLAFLIIQPADIESWARTVSFALSGFTIMIYLLGVILWRFLWSLVPSLNSWIYPNLNGNWSVTLRSNIEEIAKHHPDFKGQPKPSSITTGSIQINQSMFRISLFFRSQDRSSSSGSVFVIPERDWASGRCFLSYIYQGDIEEPRRTDSPNHDGAARLEVIIGKNQAISLKGTYWTNRNWHKAANTAGKIEMKRPNDARNTEILE